MENLLHMSFLPTNLATVKASATDIAHQAGPCGVGGGKGWKGNLKTDYSLSLTHKYSERGDYAKVDKVGKGKGWRGNFKMD
ncbi:hypothetical protein T4A_9190 [Trichinella pseudospiralis]|uniref:Uncharacterized protein n=1 Tax=Trichinella pseudospiralis TaxID=6337 RepID=A0A0V1E5U7_TRIPS|nr:hypothetical protein T4A_9190 [Trichinella pseudospiralis]